MITETITPLPTAPTTSDPTNFRARGDAFLAALNTFDDEMNTVISEINTTAQTINDAETSAVQAKDAAVSSANFVGIWSSATAYTVGQSVYYNGIIYRALQAGTNQQPDTQTTYWASIAIASEALLTLINQKVGNTGDETIGGIKTFSSTVVFDGNVGVGVSSPNAKLHVKDGISGFGLEFIPGYLSGTVNRFLSYNRNASTYQPLKIDGSEIRFSINASDKVKVTSGGLVLPNASSSDATTLDWYEEGTFTPTIIGETTAGVGTYNVQLGKYTRIGNNICISIYLTINAHTGTGNMNITGLPFTNSTVYVFATSLTISSLTFSGVPTAVILPSTSNIKLYSQVSNTGLTGISMDTACTLYVSATYQV